MPILQIAPASSLLVTSYLGATPSYVRPADAQLVALARSVESAPVRIALQNSVMAAPVGVIFDVRLNPGYA
ncbi:MAG: hypothetical protein L6Q71_04085 [Planctomycetes bacterium]|nr:hypothetical protein [Planctomycetota bacterium]NUQ33811.1 hypothetical protein [Planctomycetaceae bacterium]